MKLITRYFTSIRFRIFLLILIFGIAPGFVLRAGLLYAYEDRAVELRTTEITSQTKLLGTQVVEKNYLNHLNDRQITAQLEQMATFYDGRILLMDKTFTVVYDTFNLDEDKLILSDNVVNAYNGKTVEVYNAEDDYIEVAVPLLTTDGAITDGVMLVSVSTDNIMANKAYLKDWIMLIQLLLIVVVILAGFIASSHMVLPFRNLAKSIRDVKNGYESDFIPVNRYYETATISRACDDLLSRLQLMDQTRQEFVSNVSHELKTPLTSMKVLADSLIGQENVPVEFYREFMTDIGAEIDRENKIINDLLSLVKMDKQEGVMNVESMNINDLLELLMKRLKPIAQEKNVDLVLESFRPVIAEIDEVKMTLALSNLIENAIKYNRPEGYVHVTLNADHQNFYVTVEDNGIGIPEADQSHIFERFYRVDKSHSRDIGGTGLGLAICSNAIVMHRGAIKVHSVEGQGTTFTVRVPLNYIAKTQ